MIIVLGCCVWYLFGTCRQSMPTTQAKQNTPDASQAHNDIQLIFEGGCATVPPLMSGNYSRTGGNCFWWSKLRPRHCNGARFCINVAPGSEIAPDKNWERCCKCARTARRCGGDALSNLNCRQRFFKANCMYKSSVLATSVAIFFLILIKQRSFAGKGGRRFSSREDTSRSADFLGADPLSILDCKNV